MTAWPKIMVSIGSSDSSNLSEIQGFLNCTLFLKNKICFKQKIDGAQQQRGLRTWYHSTIRLGLQMTLNLHGNTKTLTQLYGISPFLHLLCSCNYK